MAQSDESPQAPSETKKPRWHTELTFLHHLKQRSPDGTMELRLPREYDFL
ncbi:MAG: hypothetical protein ABII03_03925 [Nanoarchaeota archaeon]|nr:hypothetical protein [Nanoarchaeota archaeon]